MLWIQHHCCFIHVLCEYSITVGVVERCTVPGVLSVVYPWLVMRLVGRFLSVRLATSDYGGHRHHP